MRLELRLADSSVLRWRASAGAVSALTRAPQAQRYRPDVDGLRAIAVLSVFAFHLYPDACPGGFVGVDIFFVISGFLISRIIMSEVDAGRFTFVGFYERRVRRIVPALIGLLVGSSIGAAILLPPTELIRFGNSAAAAALSAANFYFWKHTGYFDSGSNALPLLHTWSLGVEEQFYAAFPLIFVVGRRLKLSWKAIIVPLSAMSLAVALLQTPIDHTGAFYSPLTRAWEFLAGALLAAGIIPQFGGRAADALAAIGGLLLLISFVGIDDASPFPGWRGVLPVAGSVALIAGGSAILAAPLRTAAAVFVGRVSYSLYLWHWPVIVAARIFWGGRFSLPEAALVVVVSSALAYVSWRFVEEPLRRRRATFTRRRLFAGAAAAVILTIGGMIAANALHGLPQRYSARATAFLRDERYTPPPGCSATLDACLAGDRSAAPAVAVIGDSIALHLLPGIDHAAAAHSRSVLYLASGGCFPLVGVDITPGCARFVDAALARVRATPTVKIVLLIGRWPTAVEPRHFGRQNSRTKPLSAPAFAAAFAGTRAGLPGRELLMLTNVPEQPVDPPIALADEANLGLPLFGGVSRGVFDQRVARSDQLLASLVPRSQWIDASRALCNASRCIATLDGRSLYFDDNHPSTLGAEYLAKQGLFEPVFR